MGKDEVDDGELRTSCLLGSDPRGVVVTLAPEESLVKSRNRVKSYGEVFTPRHMVDRMLDLVADELEGLGFVDKTFLEPSAGDGNFLVAILQRKLSAVERMFEQDLWPQESLFALASIYGIELLEDNHEDAKETMLEEFVSFHRGHGTGCHAGTNLKRAASYLIDTNIVRGNTLTSLDHQGREIQFSWWNRVPNLPGAVERQPFRFASLREDSMFDFAVYDTYAVCQIDRVHHEVKTHA